jgi:hypothetical protein
MPGRLAALARSLLALLTWAVVAFFFTLILSRDVYVAADTSGRTRQHVRAVEFDFVDWTVAAVAGKLRQASLDEQAYLSEGERAAVVREFFHLRQSLEGVEGEIAARFADPDEADPQAATAGLAERQAALRAGVRRVQPLAEAVLQEQLAVILAEQGLTTLGQPIPPVSFHFTPLPYALIVSPRDAIRQEANLDVSGELTLEEIVALEEQVASALDVSTLIVPLGGIGTYPTMVAQSSNFNWAASVVAHEWIHNYLTLRPLGVNYLASEALRTMNETTAEMAGEELGRRLLERYYPDLAPPPPAFDQFLRREPPPESGEAPRFDFRAEMHATRVRVDALLAAGEVEAAEQYMEARRRYFHDHGYQIRKLNQAYFAFYGAYAGAGGGAGGADPVGNAVRLLRRRSPTLADFVNTMAVFSSYEQLERHLGLRGG